MPEQEFFGRRIGCCRIGSYLLTLRHYDRDLQVPEHEHGEAYLTAVISGGYEENTRRQRRRCGRHSVVVHGPGERHANRFGAAATRCLDVHGKDFSAGAVIAGGAGAAIASKLYREFLYADTLSPLVIEALLLEAHVEVERTQADSRAPRWLRDVRRVIDLEFAQPLTLAGLAAGVDVHPTHLARSFRGHYGRTVGEAVRERRVSYAQDQLASSRMPLRDIAMSAGFADQSHLTRTFRLITGMTPAAFRALYATSVPGAQRRSRSEP